MRHTPIAKFEDSSPGAGVAALLEALRQTHRQLLAEMANMEDLTREKAPDRRRYSQVRWRLSQASLARRTLSARICAGLGAMVEQKDRQTLKEIRTADCELARNSAAHIHRWSADRIEADWLGYCQASREMRWKMEAHLDMERRFLLPLLERPARLETAIEENGASDGARTRDLRRDRPAL